MVISAVNVEAGVSRKKMGGREYMILEKIVRLMIMTEMQIKY